MRTSHFTLPTERMGYNKLWSFLIIDIFNGLLRRVEVGAGELGVRELEGEGEKGGFVICL